MPGTQHHSRPGGPVKPSTGTPQSVPNPAVVLLTLAVSLVVSCAVFAWNPPAPRYFPMERVWRMPSDPTPGPAMGWYGRTGVALGAAVLAGATARAALRARDRRRRLEMTPATVYAVTVAMAAVLLLSLAAIVHEQRDWFAKPPTVHLPDHEY